MSSDPTPPATGYLRVRADRGRTVLELHGEIDIAAAWRSFRTSTRQRPAPAPGS